MITIDGYLNESNLFDADVYFWRSEEATIRRQKQGKTSLFLSFTVVSVILQLKTWLELVHCCL